MPPWRRIAAARIDDEEDLAPERRLSRSLAPADSGLTWVYRPLSHHERPAISRIFIYSWDLAEKLSVHRA
jgi:hypothetical protein